MTEIAGYVNTDPDALAAVLREAGVLAALSQRRATAPNETQPSLTGMLAAARDVVAEQLPVGPAPSGPRELAAATWEATPSDVRERRDVQAAVVWTSPAMVVSLKQLHLAAVNEWLEERGVPPLPDGVGWLRGLLIAWRGHAAIFVDGTLPEPERRFTLAHEHGHLLLDYFVPRQRVMRDAPELLDVIDGHRLPTDADRARAILARVPLGVHTHMLHRDDHGGAAETTLRAEEGASIYALELLAPWDDVLNMLRAKPLRGTYSECVAAAAAELAEAFDIPAEAAQVRATGALAALGIRPGFFDR
ncbi:MAG: hypothetical protein QJR12_17235 [Mycobacterium sp.]|uniref:ImmA/IrrE family metallo-endopeptidase n=1 Tax=Mycobacterium sp. TaxID=1785 RepID=UPI0026388452|nr:ImmA/IrrE family metallo-endopeptidase [Mycobacterium sp.]MDI3315945.1 hypothetical protein [Mycobacterium sp.]